MPSETFLNLSRQKKANVTEAIQRVILRKPLAKISVSDLVKEAAIPRGSFYQYFEDLTDAYKYVVDYSFEQFETEILSRVQNKSVQFFEYLLTAFDDDMKFFKEAPHHNVVMRIFDQGQNNIDYEDYAKRNHTFYHGFIKHLDRSELNTMSERRQMRLFFTLSQLKMQFIRHVIAGRLAYEDARNEYQWLIQTFRRGLNQGDLQ